MLNHKPSGASKTTSAVAVTHQRGGQDTQFGWVKQEGSGRWMTSIRTCSGPGNQFMGGNGRISLSVARPPVLSLRVRESTL